MNLRVVHVEEVDLPFGASLSHGLRRPGELHEAIVLPADVAELVNEKACASRVPVALAAALLIEMHLLEQELLACGVEHVDPPDAVVTRRLSTAEARYLRGLTWRRKGTQGATVVAMPVRLLPHLNVDALRDAAAGDLECAIRWEAAAVALGKTMVELGLTAALRQASVR